MLTALNINGQKAVTITSQTEKGLYVALYMANDEYEPVGEPNEQGLPDKSEEEFHKMLRADATAAGHYIPEFSTNPELNSSKSE